MTYTTILADVKTSLGITGNYQDAVVQDYIDEVKEFMINAGVKSTLVNSVKAKGVIARGVADLWNYGSGGTSLSPYFVQRVTQLAYQQSDEPTIQELLERIEALEESAIVTEDAR